MRSIILAAVSALALAQGAHAQDNANPDNPTSFRGIRIEGDAGAGRYQAGGGHNTKFGYGATVGFDGQIGQKIVIGAEGTYWRPNHGGNQHCFSGVVGGDVCDKSFQEFGTAIRAGYLITPELLVFGKGGWVRNEQRRSFDAPQGETNYYVHAKVDGYQVGGGVEYDIAQFHLPVPVYVNVQYVYSNYANQTSQQRLMGGIGIHLK